MIGHFFSLIRFSHTLFALPFALLAAVMAWRWQALDQLESGKGAVPALAVRWQEVVGVLIAMIAARSAAMAFNRLADRRFDAANPRTSQRHIPAGILTTTQVALFTCACSAAFVASTLLFLPNRLPLELSIPVLLLLSGYSFAKRFTSLSHFWLGGALGLAPVAAWIAIRGQSVRADLADLYPAALLGGAVFFWVAGFDVIYACQDAQFDRGAGLHSLPARFGVSQALHLAAGSHLATLGCLVCLPVVYPQWGWFYWLGVAGVAALLVYEHYLVRPDDLDRVNLAFFQVNAVISMALLAVGAIDAVW